MGIRRVGVRVSVTGEGNEFRSMARDAAAAQLAIRSIPNRVSVRADTSGLSQIERNAMRAQRSSSLLVDSLAILTPTLAPLSVVAVAGIGGIANQAAIATAAIGPMVLALSGVGDAVKAIEKARLDPTAANLEAASRAMSTMPADAQQFVRYLDGLRPVLADLRAASANGGMLRGFTVGMDEALTRMPQLLRIVEEISSAQGELATNSGLSLGGPEFDAFFDMIERTAKPTLLDLGAIIGNLAKTGANLWVAFEPLNTGFSQGLRDMTASLEQWSRTTDFTDFMSYVRESAPLVLDALGSLANMFVQVGKAGSGLGGLTLRAITATADALATIADSPAGPALIAAAAGFAALNRALVVQAKLRDSLAGSLIFGRRGAAGARADVAGLAAVQGQLRRTSGSVRQFRGDVGVMASTWATAGARTERESARMAAASERVRGSLGRIGRGAAPLAAVGVAASGAADGFGLANTATLALAGSMAGPWGAAAGTVVGGMLDIKAAGDDVTTLFEQMDDAAKNSATNIALLAEQRSTAMEKLKDAQKVTGFKDWFGDLADNIAAGGDGELNRALQKRIDVNAALSQDAKAANLARANHAALAGGYRLTGSAAREAEGGIAALDVALGKSNAQVARYQMITSYRQALNGLNKTSKEVRYGTLEARSALGQFAAQANATASTMRNAERRRNFLDGARDSIIRAAVAMGATRAQARRLADALGLVDRQNPRPKVDLDKSGFEAKRREVMSGVGRLDRATANPKANLRDGASAAINRIRANLRNLDGDTATITTIHNNVYRRAKNQIQSLDSPAYSAMGSTVPKDGLPYADRYHYLLAPGEEVISNRYGQADRWRPLLKAINANRLADGGTAQAYRAASSSSTSVKVSMPSLDGLSLSGTLRLSDGRTGELVDGRLAVQQARSHDRRKAAMR